MKPTLITTTTLLCMLLFTYVTAQELKFSEIASAELSKDARDGRYGGTYLNGNSIDVVYAYAPKKEPLKIDRYRFNNTLKFQNLSDEGLDKEKSANEFSWYVPESMAEKTEPSSLKWIYCNRAFGGGMKFTLGTMKKNFYKGFYVGREFIEEDNLKAKTGDIWRVIPGGFKSTSTIEAIATSNGFAQKAAKYGNPLTAPANAPILAAGIIQEKVKLKNPPPTNGNRVAIMSIDGNNFDNTNYNIYILPFSAMTMASGLGQDDYLTNLFVPLNAPSTVAEHKPLLWKDRKDIWCMIRFNDNVEMVDSVFFRSKLMWGNFQIHNGQGSTFAIGA
ncbi:MAG: hypothetical protein R3345_15615, partial [Fulvivirga sp.]|nr:hypothetical protein [Fulvivirga sp.]